MWPLSISPMEQKIPKSLEQENKITCQLVQSSLKITQSRWPETYKQLNSRRRKFLIILLLWQARIHQHQKQTDLPQSSLLLRQNLMIKMKHFRCLPLKADHQQDLHDKQLLMTFKFSTNQERVLLVKYSWRCKKIQG